MPVSPPAENNSEVFYAMAWRKNWFRNVRRFEVEGCRMAGKDVPPGQHRRRGGADNRFGESHQLSGGKNGLSRLEKFPQIFRGVQLWRREKSALLHMRQKPLTRPRIARDKIVRHLIAEQ